MANTEAFLKRLEKNTRAKMHSIKNKTLEPSESNIGFLLNEIKKRDEPLYDELIAEYKKVLKSINKVGSLV